MFLIAPIWLILLILLFTKPVRGLKLIFGLLLGVVIGLGFWMVVIAAYGAGWWSFHAKISDCRTPCPAHSAARPRLDRDWGREASGKPAGSRGRRWAARGSGSPIEGVAGVLREGGHDADS